jgi:SAM-dependent methyltransferase
MIDDVSDIRETYNGDPEKEHNRLIRHQLEYDMTWRYFEKYLPADGSILEIGAATGMYTLEFARRGYTITAVDMSEALLALCQRRVKEAGYQDNATFVTADARDLNLPGQQEFDAVLLMGPLYHLVVEDDRVLALNEAYKRLKPGGIFISSWISRFGIFGDIMKNIPEWIENQEEVRSILAYGRDPADAHKGQFRGYFATVPEIAPLHEKVGLTTLVVAAVEPAISADDKSYNVLEGERRQTWLDLLFEVSTEESTLGASRHLMYIGKK